MDGKRGTSNIYLLRHIYRYSYTHLMFVSAQKNTHYLLMFDSLVIIVCLTSAVLCARSIILAVRLLQVVKSVTHYQTFF